MRETLRRKFSEIFGNKPQYLYKAPSRINLIGEHIDYNGGNVLPAAISKYIYAVVSVRDDDLISVASTEMEGEVHECKLNEISYTKENDWANYVFGMFKILMDRGYKITNGLNILISSQIPVGSGLSSSAALLDLICYILNDLFHMGINNKNIAILAQRCENEFCGLRCGIMDEASIALGLDNMAMLLDCAKFEYSYHPLNLGDYTIVVLKTNKPRKLVESKYNERVDECKRALETINGKYLVNNLCEIKIEALADIEKLLNDDVLFRRVKHVVTENYRVDEFVKALNNNDIKKLGELLNLSHESLKNDYEVTGEHLDTIVDCARKHGAIGARMTGAGFGGCAIALIKKADFEVFKKEVESDYHKKLNIEPEVFMVDIVSGPKKDYEYDL